MAWMTLALALLAAYATLRYAQDPRTNGAGAALLRIDPLGAQRAIASDVLASLHAPAAEAHSQTARPAADVLGALRQAPSPSAGRGQVSREGRIQDVNITFYDCLDQGFCGDMYNGEPVYEGAAACSWDLPIGARFVIPGDPTGRVYVCKDRGLLPDTWVDVFWYDPAEGWAWQAQVGRLGAIDVIDLPR